MRILFLTGSVTNCPVMGGERLRELSARGISTMLKIFSSHFYNSSIMTYDDIVLDILSDTLKYLPRQVDSTAN